MIQGNADTHAESPKGGCPRDVRDFSYERDDSPIGWCSLCQRESQRGVRCVQVDGERRANYWWRFCAECVREMADALDLLEPTYPREVPAPATPKRDSKRPTFFAEIPADAKAHPCRSCDRAIVFVVTERGKPHPVDFDGETRGQSHFATCPDADKWRRPARQGAKR